MDATTPVLCLGCDSPLSKIKLSRRAKFCSDHCKRLWLKRRYRERRPAQAAVNPHAVGCMSELAVSIDLLRRGFEVYRALNGIARCDLAVLRDGKLVLVEVTTGHRTHTGRMFHKAKDPSKYDVLAVVLGDEILYQPPWPET